MEGVQSMSSLDDPFGHWMLFEPVPEGLLAQLGLLCRLAPELAGLLQRPAPAAVGAWRSLPMGP